MKFPRMPFLWLLPFVIRISDDAEVAAVSKLQFTLKFLYHPAHCRACAYRHAGQRSVWITGTMRLTSCHVTELSGSTTTTKSKSRFTDSC